MRILVKLALLAATICTTLGCAQNYYSVPQETLEKKIRVIGVAPFFVDADSDIRHPDKAEILNLLQTYNTKNEKELIGRLRDTGSYYAVRPIDEDPVRLFSKLVAYRERRDDAGIVYNKYFYKREELKPLLAANGLDAVLLVTASGILRPDKVYASNYLSYLETEYNFLILTAQLLDRDGNTLWEYPNFRRSALNYPLFFRLQYPDFDEAAANLSDKVEVRFKSLAGINAAFARANVSKVNKEQKVSALYSEQYDEMLSLLKTSKPLFTFQQAAIPAAVAEPAPAPPAKETAAPAALPTTGTPTAPPTAAPAATTATSVGATAPAGGTSPAAPAATSPMAEPAKIPAAGNAPVSPQSPAPVAASAAPAKGAPVAPAAVPAPPQTAAPASEASPAPAKRPRPLPLSPEAVPLGDIVPEEPVAK